MKRLLLAIITVAAISALLPVGVHAASSASKAAQDLSNKKLATAYCAVPANVAKVNGRTTSTCVKQISDLLASKNKSEASAAKDSAVNSVAKVADTYCGKTANRKSGESEAKCLSRVLSSPSTIKAASPSVPSPTNPGDGKLGSPSSLGIPALSIGDIGKNVVNVLTFIAGAISAIFIAIGGIRYTTSNGNQDQIKSAKHTLQYAVTGLVVSLLAYGIVALVLAYSPKP